MLGQLNGLEVFVTVAEKRGFSAAARGLGISASAASQAVRALEERLGVALLVRTTRSVNLTEAGQQLLARVAPALGETHAALRDVKQALGRVQGTFKLTVGRVNVPLVVEPLLGPLLADYPELTIEVSVNDRFVDIVKEGFDAGIRLEEAIEPDLAAVRLLPPFRLLVVGAPSYLARCGRPKTPRDLLDHDCITYRLPGTGSTYRWELERAGREEQVAVTGRIVCNDSTLMRRAALDGLGLAYLLEPEAAPLVARGELEIVLEDYAPRVPGLFLYFARGAERQPKLRAFIDTARKVLVTTSPGSPSGRAGRRSSAG
jgi:DNA-binding transcriptional LysR family regulator